MEAYNAGQRIFGESRPQEMVAKHTTLPSDIQWHLIGHLQTNKVRMIAPFVSLVHSVDSAHLLRTIESEAVRASRRIDVLLEIFIAREESKHGWAEDELMDYITTGEPFIFNNIHIRGLMGIASNTDDADVVGAEFSRLREFFDRLKNEHFKYPGFDTLSMGMTSDYESAIAHGSNMVRIGSMIFK